MYKICYQCGVEVITMINAKQARDTVNYWTSSDDKNLLYRAIEENIYEAACKGQTHCKYRLIGNTDEEALDEVVKKLKKLGYKTLFRNDLWYYSKLCTTLEIIWG